jgi:hypothetical protein
LNKNIGEFNSFKKTKETTEERRIRKRRPKTICDVKGRIKSGEKRKRALEDRKKKKKLPQMRRQS